MEEALQRILPEVDRSVQCALTMAYLQGCTDTASVSDCLITGAEKCTRRTADSLATSSTQFRDVAEAETRFHRLAAGFGYVDASLVQGSFVDGNFIDTEQQHVDLSSENIIDLSSSGSRAQQDTGSDATERVVGSFGRNADGDVGDQAGFGRDVPAGPIGVSRGAPHGITKPVKKDKRWKLRQTATGTLRRQGVDAAVHAVDEFVPSHVCPVCCYGAHSDYFPPTISRNTRDAPRWRRHSSNKLSS